MCGIAGAWLLSSRKDPRGSVRVMREYMVRRGPDADGEWWDSAERICFGHRRLAIIDLDPRANQPMVTEDGEYVISFNGEIYNYRELRQQLAAGGAKLRTASDTEVILELYRRHGPSAFAMLRGMFALAIWDAPNRALMLARDPYGIKPLYLADTAEGVLFASQVKALEATGFDLGRPDPAGVTGFFMYGSVPEPFTLHERVRSIPAGSFICVTPVGVSAPIQYAELGSAWEAPAFSDRNLLEEVREAVVDSVRAHLVADVPVAVLLSGGVDSGVIAGLMSEFGQAVEGVTVTFREFSGTPEDEAIGARSIATRYGVSHTERLVTRTEFLDDLPAILRAMDQPTVDGVNTWFASKAVAERGYKVVLSGIGGDELFCGYDTFRNVPRLAALGQVLKPFAPVKGIVNSGMAQLARAAHRPKLRWLAEYTDSFERSYQLHRAVYLPEELPVLLGQAFVRTGLEKLDQACLTAKLRGRSMVAFLESTRYLRYQLLRDSDWTSMAHSLEMRTPFADWRLLRKLGPLVTSLGQSEGKRALAAAPNQALPSEVVTRRKTGFGLPMKSWLPEVKDAGAVPPEGPWARTWAHVVGQSFGVDVGQTELPVAAE